MNLQPNLLHPVRTQVFGVFTASVNTVTNQGTIDMWDYSLHVAIANLNSSFAYAKPKRNNDKTFFVSKGRLKTLKKSLSAVGGARQTRNAEKESF